MLDAYRKFRSLLRRPIWLTVGNAPEVDRAGTSDDGIDEETVHREAPDTSHVAPPTADAAPRDEAIELLERRLDVMASRADRLERSVESLSPVRILEMPSRAEFRAVEERAEANRKRGEELARQLTELREADERTAATRTEAQAALTDLASAKARLEERIRDLAEEIADVRQITATLSESMTTLRETLADREAFQTATLSRRLAGAYTVAVVALLAAMLTLVLYVVR